ncbi:MAG TPA: hypothetical protein VGR30_03075 [Candidatus Binatia bacterium]|jgi:hypothetical protein|nr:hypothetical protein [Candidatus Binatia bacterium]
MKTVLLIAGLVLAAVVLFLKAVRWRWFRDAIEDRWLEARAIKELLHPDGYFGDVEEFSSIPIRSDEALRRIQQGVVELFDDPANFVEPPTVGKNEYPNLSPQGRQKVIELGRILEEELPNYSLTPNAPPPSPRAG